MISETLNSYDHTLTLIRRAVVDVTAAQATRQPLGLPNHPAWTLGHLVHSAEAIGGELGLSAWLPTGWSDRYGTGSRPVDDPGAYPPLPELLERLEDARARLGARLPAMGPAGLAAPLPDARYRSQFPTVGHAVLHILSAHTAFHAGQLMAWRRAVGLSTEAAL